MGFKLRKGDQYVETPSEGTRKLLLGKGYEDVTDSLPEVVLFEVPNVLGDDAGDWKLTDLPTSDTPGLFGKRNKGK